MRAEGASKEVNLALILNVEVIYSDYYLFKPAVDAAKFNGTKINRHP
jgi:hypothetical protein